MENRACTKCSVVQPQTDFVKSTICKSGYRGICKTCFNAYYAKRRVEKYDLVRSYEKKFHRARRLKYTFGITEEDFTTMYKEQAGVCAICKLTSNSTLHIDHCHTTGKVRGLLCSRCNTGLGQFKDSIESLQEAIKYLEKQNANH